MSDEEAEIGPGKPVGYGAALEELQEILSKLESENVDVDRLASRVERAGALIRLCQGRLAAAELQVERVVDALDTD
jgi:exodeoxyribonuclease VII small subunit